VGLSSDARGSASRLAASIMAGCLYRRTDRGAWPRRARCAAPLRVRRAAVAGGAPERRADGGAAGNGVMFRMWNV